MKTFKPILPIAAILLLVSLACSALQPAPPTSTPLPPTPTRTAIPTSTSVPPTLTVTASPTAESLPASRIVYSLFVKGEGVFIHTVDADGQNDVRLTQDDCLGLFPVWSPDASLITYYCYDGKTKKANLWVMNADGSDAHFVAVLPDLIIVKWSPDNQKLVYHAPRSGGEMDIYVLDLATGKSTDITKDSPVWDAFPDWSPNGDRIVFTSDRAPEGKALDDIWTMNPDGSDPVNLTNNGEDWEDYHSAWSPDGKSIAFFRGGSLSTDEVKGGPGGIWVMDADGQNQRLVTRLDIFRAVAAPVWSRDGKYLAYILGLEDEQDVWVVPVAGGEPVNVSNVTGAKSDISWSPDSRALIFTNDNNTADTLYVYVALPDGSDTHKLLPEARHGFGNWAP